MDGPRHVPQLSISQISTSCVHTRKGTFPFQDMSSVGNHLGQFTAPLKHYVMNFTNPELSIVPSSSSARIQYCRKANLFFLESPIGNQLIKRHVPATNQSVRCSFAFFGLSMRSPVFDLICSGHGAACSLFAIHFWFGLQRSSGQMIAVIEENAHAKIKIKERNTYRAYITKLAITDAVVHEAPMYVVANRRG